MHNVALRELDDDEFYRTRGTLRDGPDPTAASLAARMRIFASSDEDDAFNQRRGPSTSADGVDEDGTYGVEVRATHEEPSTVHNSARTEDPLNVGCEVHSMLLSRIRALYLRQTPLAGFSPYAGFTPYIQEFIRFKYVCSELLDAWSEFWADGSIDWVAFSQSTSTREYAVSCDMRTDLAALAMS